VTLALPPPIRILPILSILLLLLVIPALLFAPAGPGRRPVKAVLWAFAVDRVVPPPLL
jgi:hypothetical protein